MEKKLFKFMVSINGGIPQEIITTDSLYNIVAAKSVTMFMSEEDRNKEVIVKIWQEGLVGRFGYLHYKVHVGQSRLITT